jgi:hypothetical protein
VAQDLCFDLDEVRVELAYSTADVVTHDLHRGGRDANLPC